MKWDALSELFIKGNVKKAVNF